MAGETVITVVGNITAPAELRFTPSGAAVANFTIASTARTLDKNTNEWKDGDPLFLRCNAWRDLAEHIAETLDVKGMRVIAQGRLKQRSYEKDGQNHTVYELEVDEIGPSLKWAIAKVERTEKTGGSPGGSDRGRQSGAPSGGNFDDPWAGQGKQRAASSFDDNPPF